MKHIDPKEIPDLLADVISWWGLQNVAKALGVTDRSIRRWKTGEGLDKILPRNLNKLAELMHTYTEGGDTPPPLMTFSRAAQQGSKLAIAKAAAAESRFGVEAASVVRLFYEAIASHDTKRAWTCLTRAFQERRWKRGYTEFDSGYTGFKGLDNLVATPLKPIGAGSCRVLVYYEETTEVIDFAEAARWRSASLEDLIECSEDLARVRERILTATKHPAEVDKLALSSLSNEQMGNILLMASRLSPEEFSSAVGQTTLHQSLLAVTMIAIVRRSAQAKMLIDSLLSISFSTRPPGR